MQDRFKFRAVLHQNKYEEYQLEKFSHQRVFDAMSINLGIEYSTIEIIAEYPNGDWAVREIDDKDVDLIQSTGLKDKNGKLIYEGDIVNVYVSSEKLYRYQVKFEIGSFMLVSNDEIFDFPNKWNDNVYPLSQLYFEYENEDYCVEQLEVIGNVYENPELLGVKNE